MVVATLDPQVLEDEDVTSAADIGEVAGSGYEGPQYSPIGYGTYRPGQSNPYRINAWR